MFRAIIGVIVGYVFMGAAVWGFHAASEAFILEDATAPPTWWVAADLAAALVIAIMAGVIVPAIAPSPRNIPVKVLAGIVLVLGLVFAVMLLMAGEEMAEAAGGDEYLPPTWYNFSMPVLGCVGVLIGGGLKRKPGAAAPPAADSAP